MAGNGHDQNVDGDDDELALGLDKARNSDIRNALMTVDAKTAQLLNGECAKDDLGYNGEQIAHNEDRERDRCADRGAEK